MIRPPGLRRFLILVRRSALSDGELAAFLQTSVATVSRLKAGKIQKMAAYIERLERRYGGGSEPMSLVMSDLAVWADQSDDLKTMLQSVHRFAQESAEL